jgi:hypothetical protein
MENGPVAVNLSPKKNLSQNFEHIEVRKDLTPAKSSPNFLRYSSSDQKSQKIEPILENSSFKKYRYEPERKPKTYDSSSSVRKRLNSMEKSRSRSKSRSKSKPRRTKKSKKFEVLQKEIHDLKDKITTIEGTIARSSVVQSIKPIQATHHREANSVNFQNSQLQNLNIGNEELTNDPFYRPSNLRSTVLNNSSCRNLHKRRRSRKKSKARFNKSRGVHEALEKFERKQKSFSSKLALSNVKSGYRRAVHES